MTPYSPPTPYNPPHTFSDFIIFDFDILLTPYQKISKILYFYINFFNEVKIIYEFNFDRLLTPQKIEKS